jgi:hypothetical protein
MKYIERSIGRITKLNIPPNSLLLANSFRRIKPVKTRRKPRS